MSLWKIAWRSVQRRSLASLLTATSMALGVTLVVAVLLIHGIIAESFRSNSSLGYNLIIGPNKGGKLQLVLNTVFYLSQPVENVPYSFYQDFLNAQKRGDGIDGKWHNYVERVIPLCLGDYYDQYRLVGTNQEMFNDYVYDEDTGAKYEFSAGRNFEYYNREHGFFEAIVGARVAKDKRLKIGDTIAASHGSVEGSKHEDTFYVVGILAPSGTPNDRAVFVNMEGFYLLNGHAKTDNADAADTTAAPPSPPVLDPLIDANDSRPAHVRQTQPLPVEHREVTAMLVKTNLRVARGLSNMLNEGRHGQAVFPVGEIMSLFNFLVKPFQQILLALTAMICVVSGIGILVSIYNSMSDRKREIAIMRSLGAGRRTVMSIVLLEAIILALGGGLLGWFGGHALIAAANPWIEGATGVAIRWYDMAPPINVLEYLSNDATRELNISTEWILIPSLIVLAVVVGFLPAIVAYRTDVAEALSANP